MTASPPTAPETRPRTRTGAYSYWRNGVPAEVVETFRLAPLPGGGAHIISERQLSAIGIALTVEAEAEAGGPGALFGPVRRFSAVWRPADAEAGPAIHAAYALAAGGFTIERAVFGSRAETVHHPAASPVVFSPLMRIFQGPVIRRVAALGGGGPVPVVVPWVFNVQDTTRLLTPHIDARSARSLGPCALQPEWAAAPLPAARYAYLGERYDETAEFDLDAEAVLLRYSFRESASLMWEVRLSAYEYSA